MSTSTSVRRPSSTFFFSFRAYIPITASHCLQALGKYQSSQVLARIETGVRFGAEINKRNVNVESQAPFAPNPGPVAILP